MLLKMGIRFLHDSYPYARYHEKVIDFKKNESENDKLEVDGSTSVKHDLIL